MLKRLKKWARTLAGDQRGLTTVEYVIVLCLIAAAAVTTWQQFGTQVTTWLGSGQKKIDTPLTNATKP